VMLPHTSCGLFRTTAMMLTTVLPLVFSQRRLSASRPQCLDCTKNLVILGAIDKPVQNAEAACINFLTAKLTQLT